jgi:excisionase family DNA binding protein
MMTFIDPAALASDARREECLGGSVYSLAQAAAVLGVSRITLSRWIHAGRLPAARLGHRTVRISGADLAAFLVAHRQGTAPALTGRSRSTGTVAANSAPATLLGNDD